VLTKRQGNPNLKAQPLRAFAAAALLFFWTMTPRAVLYVDVNSTNPVAPYADWSTAATNIQDAVDAASAGDQVLVTNGVYQTGGHIVRSALTNRVAVTKPLTVQSVNGPAVTMIRGYQVPGTITGAAAVRCVYLTNGAVLAGFTVTNGATLGSPNYEIEASGGGIGCESINAVVTNCIVTGNSSSAASGGGGVLFGTLYNCIVSNNTATGFGYGGGAYQSVLNNCLVVSNIGGFGGGVAVCLSSGCLIIGNTVLSGGQGGGAFQGTLNGCWLVGNSAGGIGGGATSATLNNCALMTNVSVLDGGGAYGGYLNNCLVIGNSTGTSGRGGGVADATARNCIIYYNSSPTLSNYYMGSFSYCCTVPLPTGPGNFTNAPGFLDAAAGNFHLASNSPCINAGNNAYAIGTTDLDGNPRIVGGTVDIGPYEFQSPVSIISYAWLRQYGLPADGSADFIDTDDDGMNNWQEWICGTNPTNALSVLKMLAPSRSVPGVAVPWASVNNRTYYLQRSTNLFAQPPFSTVQSNIVGQSGTTSFTDTNATSPGPYFYRVGVQ
jgi:hypothetical protein